MPNAEKYARYREDQTTIWVSKAAAAFLAKEKERAGEGAGVVLDRLLGELRRLRRAQGGAPKAGARAAGAKRAGAKTAGARKKATSARK